LFAGGIVAAGFEFGVTGSGIGALFLGTDEATSREVFVSLAIAIVIESVAGLCGGADLAFALSPNVGAGDFGIGDTCFGAFFAKAFAAGVGWPGVTGKGRTWMVTGRIFTAIVWRAITIVIDFVSTDLAVAQATRFVCWQIELKWTICRSIGLELHIEPAGLFVLFAGIAGKAIGESILEEVLAHRDVCFAFKQAGAQDVETEFEGFFFEILGERPFDCCVVFAGGFVEAVDGPAVGEGKWAGLYHGGLAWCIGVKEYHAPVFCGVGKQSAIGIAQGRGGVVLFASAWIIVG
jgi:hypothetical protein